MQDFLINFIIKLNNKYFFKKEHPFNISKNGVLNLNYSEFEYKNSSSLFDMYGDFINLDELSNKKVLEIGCGGGGKSVYLSEKYGSYVTGIDLNENFLNQAKSFSLSKNVHKKTEFHNRSALSSGFNNDTFDFIIMSDVIEHIPDTELLFNESYRILKKGGSILFDFAPYYHYFGHHLWDTIQIPWIHVFFSDNFLIKLYKKSVNHLMDGNSRVSLRISEKNNREEFHYLNKITRKKFEIIINNFIKTKKIDSYNIKYLMLKSLNFLSIFPLFRELFIKHIVGIFKK